MMTTNSLSAKVGVIVLSWNNEDLLTKCFESVGRQTYKHIKTVLVDNNSQDNSVGLTEKLYPWVEIVKSDKNGGFTAGNNLGIRYLLKDEAIKYIVLLNSDATLGKKWVEQLIEFASHKPKAAFLQGTTLDYFNHGVIDSTHIYIAENGQATQGNWRTLYDGDFGPRRIFGTNAAACMISADFMRQQPYDNFFDESFFMYLEDVDVCTRALVTGWDNFLVPHARAYHMGSASSGKNPGFSLYMTYRNNLALLYKNFPFMDFLSFIPRVIRSDYHTLRGLVGEKELKAANSLIKGRIVGVFRLPLYIGQRAKTRAVSVGNMSLIKKMMRDGTA